MNKKYISWRRVSTFKQSNSGLGLEAQKGIIRYFVERDGGELIADYAECYTGTELSDCVELRKAIDHAKKIGAILIIAKSDRFRNTIEALQVYEEMGEGNIMFCDLPHTDKFTLTLFFALAEREALIVSIRTKQALAVKKAQGAKLGAANETYQRNYAQKSKRQKLDEANKRGMSRTLHYLESKDVRMFAKIVRNVFSMACKDENFENWDWNAINTKNGNRQRILTMMRDYKELDNALFKNWAIGDDVDDVRLQVKLASYIASIRSSILCKKNYEQINDENNEGIGKIA